MAKNKEPRPPIYTISVVGLSGTEKEKGNCGVGKSCLCNRYVRPSADSYYSEHTSVLSTIDFGGRVVNNDHFLYWGEVLHRGDDGLDCRIQVIEQTEFIDDQTFLPHRSTNLQPYSKRAATTKLQSAEKLMYICTDQLGLEQDFDQKQMPDGKLNIDGDHDRNHKVPPPVRPKPVLNKPNVKKLDPNLLKTIEAGMRASRRTRGPLMVHDELEVADNYADPVDTLPKLKGYNDDIYAVPEDTHSRIVKMRNSFGGHHGFYGDEENGFDRILKSQGGRRPSKYKHRSKILFSKTKAYHRRVHSDVSDDESGPAVQKKKKGRGNRGSEEDPLLSPVDPWKGGIDNPAITSDPEQDDKKLKKKKATKNKEPKKVKTKVPKPLYPPTRRNWESNYFGVALQNLVSPDRPIPLFIEKCVDYIERTGLTTEGLYRVSGNKTDQDNIQKQFDQDHSVDFVAMDVAVNAVAGALKAFFADLPDPLIPYSLHPELVEAAKIMDHTERLQVLKDIVRKFPSVNYEVFKYMMTHLNRVSQQSKTTLMTADNLSICFWPTLMRPDFENKDTLSTTKLNQSVIESFIQQCHYFFYGGEIIELCRGIGASPPHGHMGHAGHGMVESLLALQLPPPLQPQQIQHPLPSEPLI
ncbi:Rho GTPase-activating protein 5 [Bagarius yarrelli]|uniref:Rho GTPase-activating protein 5 n=1 Tax=Bagarius yarrelli TaxID=175774 RepID=A0A556V9X4_BAGYA|nr:Rho GTPase-activating protein 5 [Bagarius yarrelli]